jgi:hypothetical protein
MLRRDRRSKRYLKRGHSNIIDVLSAMHIPSKSYKKIVPMVISIGTSGIDVRYILVGHEGKLRTDKGKHVPPEPTDSINVNGHQGHYLSLA